MKKLYCSAAMFAAFMLWTAAVCYVDVQAIGPMGSSVGLAKINGLFHNMTGVHFVLYQITDWLGLVPICTCMGFGLLGVSQWIKRKSIWKVDRSLLALGGYYAVVIALYCLFEVLVINHRPVLIKGVLEASYPSSTTMLVLCVMPTAMMQANMRIQSRKLKRWLIFFSAVFVGFMVLGRLISGVHWFTDIVGGALLSSGLVTLYAAVSGCDRN